MHVLPRISVIALGGMLAFASCDAVKTTVFGPEPAAAAVIILHNHVNVGGTWKCTGPQTAEITWTVVNTEQETAHITASSRGLFDGITLGSYETVSRTEQAVTGGDVEMVTNTTFDPLPNSGPNFVHTRRNSGIVTIPPDTCATPAPTPTPTPTPTPHATTQPHTNNQHTSSQTLTCQNGHWTYEHWYDGQLIEHDVRTKCGEPVKEEGM